jgi:hypothetical protein
MLRCPGLLTGVVRRMAGARTEKLRRGLPATLWPPPWTQPNALRRRLPVDTQGDADWTSGAVGAGGDCGRLGWHRDPDSIRAMRLSIHEARWSGGPCPVENGPARRTRTLPSGTARLGRPRTCARFSPDGPARVARCRHAAEGATSMARRGLVPGGPRAAGRAGGSVACKSPSHEQRTQGNHVECCE